MVLSLLIVIFILGYCLAGSLVASILLAKRWMFGSLESHHEHGWDIRRTQTYKALGHQFSDEHVHPASPISYKHELAQHGGWVFIVAWPIAAPALLVWGLGFVGLRLSFVVGRVFTTIVTRTTLMFLGAGKK